MALPRPTAQDIIIIGATGDLSRRKLLPALYELHREGELPSAGRIVGYARARLSDQDFRTLAREAVGADTIDDRNGAWLEFEQRLAFVCAREGGVPELKHRSEESKRIVYLAVPPTVHAPIVQDIAENDLVDGTRLLLEKPFGWDRASAKNLNRVLHDVFDESQIFRIDHYLAKEAVQNLLVLRFGNSLFERVWDRSVIDHVQITVAESGGIDGRGDYYETVGAGRDMAQNHLLAVLAFLTIEPPAAFDARALRDEKAKLFRAVRPLDPARTIRGQYTAGEAAGARVPAYHDEDNVDPSSSRETFMAFELFVDNWRWAGVPFYLRTGKALQRRVTEAVVAFRDVPIRLFQEAAIGDVAPNHLTFRIQPDEGVTLSIQSTMPGSALRVTPVDLHFRTAETFERESRDAYTRLLLDAMQGDQTFFARSDGIDAQWRVIQGILDDPPELCLYPAGSWGPKEADALIAPRRWHLH